MRERYEKAAGFRLDSSAARPLLMPYPGGDPALLPGCRGPHHSREARPRREARAALAGHRQRQVLLAEAADAQTIAGSAVHGAAEAELAAINALPAALLRRAFSGEL